LMKQNLDRFTTKQRYSISLRYGDAELPAYVFLAPGGGSCGSYLDLIQRLPANNTIITFDHPNLLHDSKSLTTTYSVKDLSQLFAQEMISIFSAVKGWIVVGASFGGVVAVDLAKELRVVGKEVKSLILFDSPWPGADSARDSLTATSFVRNVFGIMLSEHQTTGTDEETFNVEHLHSSILRAQERLSPDIKDVMESSDWKKLLPVYVENVLTLRAHEFSSSEELDFGGAYFVAQRGDIGKRNVEKWKRMLPNVAFHELEASHADLYVGENAGLVGNIVSKWNKEV
jgi:thioesterase domain-containing protein